ncbi:hypothetical protein CW677_02150 [Macrococcoides caseolyticum]|uniref:hypothetical protein n=1 Tax=Macrococcoides caseolyticum TaxID=69966 RepID=UPI000C347536|nr:hypothetical protein [Macrococcus caseolyticus]PKE48973.1 hypothetical protein CW677_02150 [Macrococcus caseolyticus]
MSSILLLSLADVKQTPYYKKYTKSMNLKPDIILIGSITNEKEEFGNIWSVQKKGNRITQIINFRKTLKKILDENKYKLIIILHSQISVICNDILLKNNISIILDIRDYIFEDNKVYSYFQNKIIKKSEMVVISSPGFKNFLPKGKYYICHNTFENYKEYTKIKHNKKDENIIIGQIGYIRFIDINKKLINSFENDRRFILKFIGKGSLDLKKKNVSNLYLKDEFNAEDTLKFYKDLDFINNYYGYGKKNLKYALSNKLYIAALLNIPIIVSPNTYMEKYVNKYNLGLSIDIEADINLQKDKIYEYYKNLDFEDLKYSCQKMLKDVEIQNHEFKVNIERIITKYENSTY